MTFTAADVIAMFNRLRPEAAEYFGDDYLLTVPFAVEPFTQTDGPDYASSMGATRNAYPYTVRFNSEYLPFMDEDEIRYTLMHEMVHVVKTPTDNFFYNVLTGGHGPNWERAVGEWTGVYGPTSGIRRINEWAEWAMHQGLISEDYKPAPDIDHNTKANNIWED